MNKINAKSFGVVIYMDNTMYTDDPETNKDIHFPETKETILINLLKSFYDIGISNKQEVVNIIIGHEHGESMKCHMQIYIEFDSRIRKDIKPGNFKINNINYLYMAQRCKTPAQLRNYCKKDKDFHEIMPNKTIKQILRENNILDELMDVDDPYDLMLNKSDLSDKQIKNIFKNCPITEYKKDFMNNSKKLLETYNNFIKIDKEEEPPFEWKFPKHILHHVENNFGAKDQITLTYVKIYTWFKTYCEPEGFFRRKALFLFSLAGGVGKSYFARSLVPEINICNSPYYVYCRGSLDAAEFIRKEKKARLIILDDVNYIDKDIEIWKALTVSEPTNIRSPYHNFAWKKSLPCIMLSNNIKTLRYWMEAEDLKTRCVFVGINFYIGPPGSDSEENHRVDSILSMDIDEKLNEKTKVNKCNSF